MNESPKQTVVINEKECEPLSDYVLNFLKSQKKESSYLDFKLTISTNKDSDFPEIVKDILAFSNYGGGWILIGWKEEKKSQFLPLGVPEDYKIDQAILQEKFNSYLDNPITLEYVEKSEEFVGKKRRFGFIYIHPSKEILKPKCDGEYQKNGKKKLVFKAGDIFYRRGTQNIHPSDFELKLIEKRLPKENYRISILSGEPDEIEEEIFSNLFEIKNLPKYVYLGEKKDYDGASIKYILKEKGINPFFDKFKEWNKKIVTFEDIQDISNPYSVLINNSSRELVSSWLEDPDKSRIIIELLNREFVYKAISKGFYHNRGSLFFPAIQGTENREQQWQARYRKSSKIVVNRMYAEQLHKYVFLHASVFVSFLRIGERIFLQLSPSFILTENGRRVISGFREGTVITRVAYSVRNNQHLNNILFWIQQFKEEIEDLIKIEDYITIDSNPSKGSLSKRIIFDLPSSEFDVDDEELESEVVEDEL